MEPRGTSGGVEGAVIGPFTVIRPLGAGGMAQVFLCRRVGVGGFDKKVVLKVIHPKHLEDPEFVGMFLDEARISANLAHPNLVHAYEVGQLGDLPYLAMEYIEGPTVARLLSRAERKHDVRLPCFAAVLAGACRGLHHAHDATDDEGRPLGLVHRDVSTQNLLVSRLGNTKVIDFGIARANQRQTATEVGILKGKLQYMAPEHFRGDDCDHRVDVFALGVVLYRTTVGAFPFDGEAPQEIWRARAKGTFTPPRLVNPAYPEALEAIVLRAMADPLEERYPDAATMADDLERYATAAGADARAVAAWIAELFPGGEAEWAETGRGGERSSAKYVIERLTTTGSQRPPEPTRELATGQTAQTLAPPPAGPSNLLLGGAVAAAIALLLAGAVGLNFALRLAERPVVPDRAVVEGAANDEAAAYLDEAERLLGERKYRAALDLLDKAGAAEAKDPAVNIRAARLGEQARREVLLVGAKRDLELGDPDRAAEKARQMLDLDPLDEGALAIVREVRAGRAAAEAAAAAEEPEPASPAARSSGSPSPREAPERPPAAREGLLSVSSEPAGLVFVDDEPVGRAPLTGHRLRAGGHVVHVRLDGYRTFEQEITLDAEQELAVSAALEPAGEAKGAADVRAMAEALSEPSPAVGPASVVAVAALTAPPPAAAASPAPKVAAAPTAPAIRASSELPELQVVRNLNEVRAVLASVERELRAGGVPDGVADNVTGPLAQALIDGYSPGQEVRLHPAGMYAFVAERAARGEPRTVIAPQLRKAHFQGTLAR